MFALVYMSLGKKKKSPQPLQKKKNKNLLLEVLMSRQTFR